MNVSLKEGNGVTQYLGSVPGGYYIVVSESEVQSGYPSYAGMNDVLLVIGDDVVNINLSLIFQRTNWSRDLLVRPLRKGDEVTIKL